MQESYHDFEASLVYLSSSRPTGVTPCSKTNGKENRGLFFCEVTDRQNCGKYTLTVTTTIIPREVKEPSLGLMQ